MSIAVTFLEQGKQPPAEVAGRLADFLAAARSSLHVAIYDFRLSGPIAEPIVRALRDRAAAGVEVRIVHDAGKPQGNVPRAGGDPAPPGTADFVRGLGEGVQGKPITGGDPQQPRLMHHKYVVRDGGTPNAALWTGSANFTDDSWTLQENNLLQIDSPELCRYYETDFRELWESGDIGSTGAHDRGTLRVGASTVEVAFAPGDGPTIDHLIARLIGGARRRLKVGSMLITSGAILGALNDVLSHHRVQEYGGVYDRTQMEGVFGQWQGQPSEWKIAAFEHAAADLVGKRSTPYTPTSAHDFMHNKVVVADDAVLTGSYNLSHSATMNAENVLVIHDAALAERYSAYIDGVVARYRLG
jgi:phosphatidylserine/phosphatidylglycerophosphate/cardiolipin synthase-like enzyme